MTTAGASAGDSLNAKIALNLGPNVAWKGEGMREKRWRGRKGQRVTSAGASAGDSLNAWCRPWCPQICDLRWFYFSVFFCERVGVAAPSRM